MPESRKRGQKNGGTIAAVTRGRSDGRDVHSGYLQGDAARRLPGTDPHHREGRSLASKRNSGLARSTAKGDRPGSLVRDLQHHQHDARTPDRRRRPARRSGTWRLNSVRDARTAPWPRDWNMGCPRARNPRKIPGSGERYTPSQRERLRVMTFHPGAHMLQYRHAGVQFFRICGEAGARPVVSRIVAA